MSVLLTMAFPTYTDDDPFIVERHYSLYLNGRYSRMDGMYWPL